MKLYGVVILYGFGLPSLVSSALYNTYEKAFDWGKELVKDKGWNFEVLSFLYIENFENVAP